MTDRAARSDPHVAALFRDGPSAASAALLARTMAATRRTAQRRAIFAVAANASRIRPSGGVAAGPPRVAAVAGVALLLLGLVIALFAVGRPDNDDRVVAPPTSGATFAPSPRPPSTAGRGTVVRIPGSTATFSVDLPSAWRLVGDESLAGDSVRIVTKYELSGAFDLVEAAWIDVSVIADPLDLVRESMVATGWSGPARAVRVAGIEAIILTAGTGRTVDPTALVPSTGGTYRITARYPTLPAVREADLSAFLAVFTPLGTAGDDAMYLDAHWAFAVLYDATASPFLPGVELGDGVTRFADAGCEGRETSCEGYVDLIRRSNSSPVQLSLPGGRAVSLDIDSSSADYTRLAAAWEATVGRSNGSATYVWQNTLIYDVQGQGIEARFIHRPGQLLVVVAPQPPDQGDRRLSWFLPGLSLLPTP